MRGILVVALLWAVVSFIGCNRKSIGTVDHTVKTLLKRKIIVDTFRNNIILSEAVGRLYALDSSDGIENVFVLWDNSYISIGQFKNRKPIGYWYTFDKNTRLRRYIVFSDGLGPLVQIFDKKGKMVKQLNQSISF